MVENQKSVHNDDPWLKHTLVRVDGEKRRLTLGYRPGHRFTMSDGIDSIKPKARVY